MLIIHVIYVHQLQLDTDVCFLQKQLFGRNLIITLEEFNSSKSHLNINKSSIAQ